MSFGSVYYPWSYIPEVDAAVLSLKDKGFDVHPFDFADLFEGGSLTSLEDMRALALKMPETFIHLMQFYIQAHSPSAPYTVLLPNFNDALYEALADPALPHVQLFVTDLLRCGLGLQTPVLERQAFLTRFQIMKDRRVLLYLLSATVDPKIQSQHIQQLLSLIQDKNAHILVKYPYQVGADLIPMDVRPHECLSFDGEWYGLLHYRTTPSLTLKDALTHADCVLTWDPDFYKRDILKDALFLTEKYLFTEADLLRIFSRKTEFSPPSTLDFTSAIKDALKPKPERDYVQIGQSFSPLMPTTTEIPGFRFLTAKCRFEPQAKSVLVISYLIRQTFSRLKRLRRLIDKGRANHG